MFKIEKEEIEPGVFLRQMTMQEWGQLQTIKGVDNGLSCLAWCLVDANDKPLYTIEQLRQASFAKCEAIVAKAVALNQLEKKVSPPIVNSPST